MCECCDRSWDNAIARCKHEYYEKTKYSKACPVCNMTLATEQAIESHLDSVCLAPQVSGSVTISEVGDVDEELKEESEEEEEFK